MKIRKGQQFYFMDCNFTATAHMHHTHLVLDEKYVPRDDNKKGVL
jgi:hypothetical protein